MKETVVLNNNNYVTPNVGETFDAYRFRVYKLKQLGEINLRWLDIATMFGETFDVWKDESKWRKEAKEILTSEVNELTEDCQITEETDVSQDLNNYLINEIKKEKVKLSDERTQNNAYIRRIAREETIKEIAIETAREMSSKKILSTPAPILLDNTKRQEAILMISDWHYGIEINNFINKFNPEICTIRVSRLLQHFKRYLYNNPVQKIYVVNLGDLIAGRIHNTIRLESRYDVITQTIHIAEILAEFLTDLTAFAPVEYYDCLDNHSRLEPIKPQSLELESLARIIPWHLKYRLQDKDVNVNINSISSDIITFTCLDGKYTVGGVHGHKDKPLKVVDNLTLMTKISFDLILTAHLHHFSCDEKNETLVVSNGSLMGTDTYAMDLRLTSRPSQNIILVNEFTVADDIHRVLLA